MTPHHIQEAHAEGDALSRLSRLVPDADRADRVRLRCRARLDRLQRREVTALVAPIVVGGVCVLYLLALLATTLRLEGVIP